MEQQPDPSTFFFEMVACQVGIDQQSQVVTLESKFSHAGKVHSGRAFQLEPQLAEQLIRGLQDALKMLRSQPPVAH